MLTLSLAKDITYYIIAWEGVNAAYTPGETSLQLRVAAFQPPVAATLPASSITSVGAVLNATVDPNGLATTAWFEWGMTTNYGSATSPMNVSMGSGPVLLSAGINGLQPLQTYHFCIVGSNTASMTRGGDRSFAWSATPPRINSFTRANDTYVLQLLGQTGQMYLIEASPDLTEWTNLGTANDMGNGNFTFADAANLLSRFYRARSP